VEWALAKDDPIQALDGGAVDDGGHHVGQWRRTGKKQGVAKSDKDWLLAQKLRTNIWHNLDKEEWNKFEVWQLPHLALPSALPLTPVYNNSLLESPSPG
jgi:hypothetical protein